MSDKEIFTCYTLNFAIDGVNLSLWSPFMDLLNTGKAKEVMQQLKDAPAAVKKLFDVAFIVASCFCNCISIWEVEGSYTRDKNASTIYTFSFDDVAKTAFNFYCALYNATPKKLLKKDWAHY